MYLCIYVKSFITFSLHSAVRVETGWDIERLTGCSKDSDLFGDTVCALPGESQGQIISRVINDLTYGDINTMIGLLHIVSKVFNQQSVCCTDLILIYLSCWGSYAK